MGAGGAKASDILYKEKADHHGQRYYELQTRI
jgi:hypothetical protein